MIPAAATTRPAMFSLAAGGRCVWNFFGVMPATVGVGASAENAPRVDLGVPLRGEAGSAVGAITRARAGRYARVEVVSHSAAASARTPTRNDLLIDAAIAVVVFAA